jgi:hypothetical protein
MSLDCTNSQNRYVIMKHSNLLRFLLCKEDGLTEKVRNEIFEWFDDCLMLIQQKSSYFDNSILSKIKKSYDIIKKMREGKNTTIDDAKLSEIFTKAKNENFCVGGDNFEETFGSQFNASDYMHIHIKDLSRMLFYLTEEKYPKTYIFDINLLNFLKDTLKETSNEDIEALLLNGSKTSMTRAHQQRLPFLILTSLNKTTEEIAIIIQNYLLKNHAESSQEEIEREFFIYSNFFIDPQNLSHATPKKYSRESINLLEFIKVIARQYPSLVTSVENLSVLDKILNIAFDRSPFKTQLKNFYARMIQKNPEMDITEITLFFIQYYNVIDLLIDYMREPAFEFFFTESISIANLKKLLDDIASPIVHRKSVVEENKKLCKKYFPDLDCQNKYDLLIFLIKAEFQFTYMLHNMDELGFGKQFIELIRKFIQINKRRQNIDSFQSRNLDDFLKLYEEKFFLLVALMGEHAFRWMSNQLAETVLPLERLLENVPSNINDSLKILLKTYFESNRNEIMSSIENVTYWKNIIISAELCSAFDVSDAIIKEKMMHKMSTKELNQAMSSSLLKAMLDALGIDKEICDRIDQDKLFSSIPAGQFALLIKSAVGMKNTHPYAEVLMSLITCYLTQSSVNDFLHNLSQDNEIGCALAKHNHGIQERLKKNNIDPILALHYKKTYSFVIKPENYGLLRAKEDSMIVFCSYLKSIKEHAKIAQQLLEQMRSETPAENQEQLSFLSKQLDQVAALIRNISKITDIKDVRQLYQEQHWGVINKINTTVKFLLTVEPIKSHVSHSKFREFANHLIEQHKIITEKKYEVLAKTKEIQPLHFKIEQWDKDKISSLFLGNEVECCLAVGSTQFPAIVQRIMDDAMLFHVVIDLKTNKPIALSWLYFAEDSDGEIYLTANFLEIKAKFGMDEAIRKTIINALLYFSGELYCDDNPAIQGFIINELNYGWNVNKLSAFQKRPISLADKVGGAFVPNPTSEERAKSQTAIKKFTCKYYYLSSLERALSTQNALFHVYTPEAITPEERKNFMPLQEAQSAPLNQVQFFRDATYCSATVKAEKPAGKKPGQ